MVLRVPDREDRHQVGVALYHRLWAISAVEAPDVGGHRQEACDRIVRLLAEMYGISEDRVDRVGTPGAPR